MTRKENPGQRGLAGAGESQRRGSLAPNNTHEQRRRQQVKRFIVSMAVWGLLPITCAAWIVRKLGANL